MEFALPAHSVVTAVARFVGIFMPTLYVGSTVQRFTSSDSLTFVEPIVTHAPTQKIAAKQWLHGYQYGPYWVPPMVMPGTVANVYLALTATDLLKRNIYMAAALSVFSVLPITFLYMEPGINGASKWKVESLLRDEGFSMPETSVVRPSSVKHGSTHASRRWAEKTDMKDLIRYWQKINNIRWIIVGFAAMLSGYATFG